MEETTTIFNQSEKNDEDDLNRNVAASLYYGDIIKVVSPRNAELHDKMFFIDYIDSEKIKLKNIYDVFELGIDENGYLQDKSIDHLYIVHRSKERGFCRQNGFIVGTTLEIIFKSNVRSIVNGRVVNIEEDMIELKIIDDTDSQQRSIFIDFEYKGIPERYRIEKITVINDSLTSNTIISNNQENENFVNEENNDLNPYDENKNDNIDDEENNDYIEYEIGDDGVIMSEKLM